MAYTDDWESLMNGVFGPGGKLRSRPKSDPETPPKQSGGFAELNAVPVSYTHLTLPTKA